MSCLAYPNSLSQRDGGAARPTAITNKNRSNRTGENEFEGPGRSSSRVSVPLSGQLPRSGPRAVDLWLEPLVCLLAPKVTFCGTHLIAAARLHSTHRQLRPELPLQVLEHQPPLAGCRHTQLSTSLATPAAWCPSPRCGSPLRAARYTVSAIFVLPAAPAGASSCLHQFAAAAAQNPVNVARARDRRPAPCGWSSC